MVIIPGLKQWRGWLLAAMLPLALLAGCASGSGGGAQATPTYPASVTPAPTITEAPAFVNYTASGPALPPFSDWRVAYIGPDGKLHLVSLDGKTTLTGVSLPIYGPASTGIYTAGTAPDGAHLVYADGGGVKYLDMHTDTLSVIRVAHTDAAPYEGLLLWSPDGHAIATNSANTPWGTAIVQLPSGAVTAAPAPSAGGQPQTSLAHGWLDATHLAVDDLAVEYPGPTPTPSWSPAPQTVACLASLDITTGQLRPIVTLRSSTMSSGSFVLTPDASEALFFNTQVQSQPFTPLVERIDLATGHATPLPTIASALSKSGGFTQLLWLPHTHLALALGGFAGAGLRYHLIDIDDDGVLSFSLSGFPVAWSPVGRTLILARLNSYAGQDPETGLNDVGIVGSGPYSLTAVIFSANWSVASSVTLTTQAMQIPVLGLVRNP